MWSILAVSTAFCLASLTPYPVVATANIVERASIVGRDVQISTTYDYIIAGAGPAGLTVADRLSENPRSTCLHSLQHFTISNVI
jgi:hypothetical protein